MQRVQPLVELGSSPTYPPLSSDKTPLNLARALIAEELDNSLIYKSYSQTNMNQESRKLFQRKRLSSQLLGKAAVGFSTGRQKSPRKPGKHLSCGKFTKSFQTPNYKEGETEPWQSQRNTNNPEQWKTRKQIALHKWEQSGVPSYMLSLKILCPKQSRSNSLIIVPSLG